MGNVIRIDGEPVEQDAPCANSEIATILEELWALNKRGLIDAVVIGAVKIDREPILYTTIPSATNIATILGALRLAEIFYARHLTMDIAAAAPA